MRLLCTFVAALALAAFPWSALADKAADEFEEVLGHVHGKEVVRVKQFTDEERAGILKYGWTRANNRDLVDNSPHLIALAVIGDQAAYSIVVRKVVEDPNSYIATAVAETGDPKFLVELAPIVFLQEEYQAFGGDSKWFPKSFVAASLVRKLTSRSPHFSDEVINWAHRFDDRSITDQQAMVEMREIVRQWWKANGDLIRSGQFSAVQPGLNPSPQEESPKTVGRSTFAELEAAQREGRRLSSRASSTPTPTPRKDQTSAPPMASDADKPPDID